MKLLLIRHGEAAAGEPDELRRLTEAGQAASRALGERLRAEGPAPDAVLTSPLLRARETGAALAKPFGLSAEPDERLAPGATAESVREAIEGRGDVVAVVAHQPDCSEIAAALTGGPEPRFPAGHMVVIDL